MPYNIAVVGGDCRLLYTARILGERGHSVRFFSSDKTLPESERTKFPDVSPTPLDVCLSFADAVILPLPASRIAGEIFCPLSPEAAKTGDVFRLIPDGAAVFAGKPDRCCTVAASERGLKLVDYYADEDFLIQNAALTAEGAIALMITTLPCALSGSRIAVFGYGRCASALSRRLISLGARLSVIARSASRRAQARSDGADAYEPEDFHDALRDVCCAVNTVPAPVIGFAEASLLAGVPVFELADVSGIADGVFANVIRAAGLPGKYSPEAAGRLIADAVSARLDLRIPDGNGSGGKVR